MQKFSLFLIISLSLFSCKKSSSDPSPSSSGPNLTFEKGSNRITADTTIDISQSGKYYIVFKMEKNGVSLKSASVYANGKEQSFGFMYMDDFSLYPGFYDQKILDSIKVVQIGGADSVVYKFTVKGADDKITEKSIKVTIDDPIGSTTYSSYITMDDTSNIHEPYPAVNFFSLSKRKGYYETVANNYSTDIDIAYVYDNGRKYICSPTDAKAQALYPFIKTWSKVKVTKFAVTKLTSDDYKKATGADIVKYAKDAGVETGASNGEITDPYTIIAWKTEDGKYALSYMGFGAFTVASVNYKVATQY